MLFFFCCFCVFIYLWLCWVFVSVRGLSLAAASGGHSSSRCAGLSLSWPLLLRSTGSRRAGSVMVPHGPSCSAACGIFPDQGLNPCPLHWQADSQPLRHQGSPLYVILKSHGNMAVILGRKLSHATVGKKVPLLARKSPSHSIHLSDSWWRKSGALSALSWNIGFPGGVNGCEAPVPSKKSKVPTAVILPFN